MAALDLLKTQIENEPKSSQSNRQKPEITSQAYQSRALRYSQSIFTMYFAIMAKFLYKERQFVQLTFQKYLG